MFLSNFSKYNFIYQRIAHRQMGVVRNQVRSYSNSIMQDHQTYHVISIDGLSTQPIAHKYTNTHTVTQTIQTKIKCRINLWEWTQCIIIIFTQYADTSNNTSKQQTNTHSLLLTKLIIRNTIANNKHKLPTAIKAYPRKSFFPPMKLTELRMN